VPLGNYLAWSDAELGLNFLNPSIFCAARERMRSEGALDEYRLLANLLSSQPMCFNLFGPLTSDLGLARELLDALLPEGVSEVLSVNLEYAPAPREEYLGDRTAFDAFFDYLDRAGVHRFVGIETKLTEPFSPQRYGRDHRPAYDQLTKASDSPWVDDVADRVYDVRWNQLWRNQLLVEATRKHLSQLHGAHGRLVVIRHQGDNRCAETISQYRKLLEAPDDSFLDLPLDVLVDAWLPLVTGTNAEWLNDFRTRYVDLSWSQSVWDEQ
jgi:hypothetical protein